MTDDIKFILCLTREEYQKALDIRLEVFCKEQGFSQEDEIDKWDATFPNDNVLNIIAVRGDVTLGTVRAIHSPHEVYDKIGRLAVSKIARHLKLGSKLVLFAEEQVKRQWQTKEIKLDSQSQVRKFYEKLGYVMNVERGEYLDDGWPHVEMKKIL